MDINAACSGFIYGLVTAEKFIQTGQVRTALVVGGEVLHPFLNWEDRNSCILFGFGRKSLGAFSHAGGWLKYGGNT